MAQERLRTLPGQRGTPAGLAYAQQEAENIRARAEAAQELAQRKREADLAAIQARQLSEQLKRDAEFSSLTTKTNDAWNRMKFEAEQKRKPKPIRVAEVERDAEGNETGRTITREVSPEDLALEKKAAQLKLLEDEKSALGSKWFFPGTRGVPGKIAEVEKKIAALQAPADVLGANSAELTPVAEEPPVLQNRIPNAFSGTTSITGPGWKPPTPTGIIGTPERNMFTAETDLPQNMNREQLNAWAIANNTPAQPAPDFRASLGDLRATDADIVNNPGDMPLAPFNPDAAPVAAPRDLLNPPASEIAPQDSAPVKMGSPSSVYENPEQVRASYRNKKIDRKTAEILLGQFGFD